ncbi:MAG: gluconate 2-dehydrogenase subunit 3 family protein [Pseudohongiellaceae bacterium]
MPDKNKTNQPLDPSRRNLLKGAGLLGTVLAGNASGVLAQQTVDTTPQTIPVREALETLTAAEAETLEAIVDRILPSDENGPGAREARAAHYIDCSLAADNLTSRELYLIGLSALDEYSVKQHGSRFHLLDSAVQDAVLTAVQADQVPGFRPSGAGFFGMVRNHTIDGTFCDPYYGGNRGFVGWDMLRYPGVRVAVSETDVAMGAGLAPNHQSAYDLPAFTKTIVNGNGGGNHGN